MYKLLQVPGNKMHSRMNKRVKTWVLKKYTMHCQINFIAGKEEHVQECLCISSGRGWGAVDRVVTQ